jgi:hypothetical protein
MFASSKGDEILNNPTKQRCQGSGEPRALSAATTASGCWALRLSFFFLISGLPAFGIGF